ncbi:sulfite oxidase [Actinocorallia aurea]
MVGGVAAAAAAVAVAEALAAAASPRPGPALAVGSALIDAAPRPVKEFAIRSFGTHDKAVLLGGIALVLAAGAVAVGLVARRRPRLGLCGLGAFAVAGSLASLTRPGASPLDALPALAGAAAGAGVLLALRAATAPAPTGTGTGPGPRSPISGPEGAKPSAGGAVGRRFVLVSGGTLALAAGTGAAAGMLRARGGAESARRTVALPAPARPAPPLPPGADLRLRGLAPFTTPNRDFYRVDTALALPQVDPRDWVLRVHGMVARPVELTFADLLGRPLEEHDITLTCVSNEVGGPYVGNARWLGASLGALLRETGVRAGADQLLGTSVDGWTCGTPLAAVLDGRPALLAVGMNGTPLPVGHGFPVRTVVPGLYGYASATKWVVDLEVTRFTDTRAYWVARGWAENAPVETLARIDVPAPFGRLAPGPAVVAGVAWAQRRGIAAVEVRVDDGPWLPARLADVPGTDTWRQWSLDWDAAPGTHRLQARATDATGALQPRLRSAPFPDGSTGWHTSVVTVSSRPKTDQGEPS